MTLVTADGEAKLVVFGGDSLIKLDGTLSLIASSSWLWLVFSTLLPLFEAKLVLEMEYSF